MITYSGFSTVASTAQKKFVLVDNDLIKQDLLNILMTPVGSRVMQPLLGCIIWNYPFENISAMDVQLIAANITSIVNNDPRIQLVSIDITPSNYNLIVTLVLLYTATNQTEQMIITFTPDMINEF